MAKISTISLARKKELDRPDDFVAWGRRVLEYILERKKVFISALAGVLGLLIIILGIGYYYRISEKRAFVLLNKAMVTYANTEKSDGPEKGFEAAEKDMQKLLDAYPNTVAGEMGQVHFANMAYKAKKYKEAVHAYEQVLDRFGEDPFMREMIQSGLAYAYAALGDQKAALKSFENILSGPGGAFKDEALYQEAILYGEMGETEKQQEALKKIVQNYPDSIYQPLAREKING